MIPGAKPIPPEQYGTSGSFIPITFVIRVLKIAGFYSFPCNSTLDVAFSFQQTQFSIDPMDFNLGMLQHLFAKLILIMEII
jgi:hypothetical protein